MVGRPFLSSSMAESMKCPESPISLRHSKHNDHVCQVLLWDISSSLLERVLALMQRPFPALTSLRLSSDDNEAPPLTDSFLDGSAKLHSISGITETVFICQWPCHSSSSAYFPHSGYFSPVMVIVLSASTRLDITFQSPRS